METGELPRIDPVELARFAARAPPVPPRRGSPAPGSSTPPLPEHVRVVAGPDGHPWFVACKRGGVRGVVYRFTADRFETLDELPTFRVVAYEGGIAYATRTNVVIQDAAGRRRRIPLDSGARPVELAAHGERIVACLRGQFYSRVGDRFALLADRPSDNGTPIFVSDTAVAILGAHSKSGNALAPLVVDLDTGKTKKLPATACTRFARMGDYVVGLGYKMMSKLDLGTRVWSRPKRTQEIGELHPLPNRDAATLATNGNVFILRRSSFALRKVGRIAVRRHGWPCIYQPDERVLVIVGGQTRSHRPVEPGLLDLETGVSRPLRGREQELPDPGGTLVRPPTARGRPPVTWAATRATRSSAPVTCCETAPPRPLEQ